MADAGTLVGSGTFRVDRTQALEKLKDFQLPDPTKFLLPWVRCAVASGATGIRLESEGARLRMQFNGPPFTLKELENPYDCLFESSTPDSARNRFLATGLLSALRLDPGEVRIISGRRPERICLRVESLERDAIEKADDMGMATVLTVEWRQRTWNHSSAALRHLGEHYGMGAIPIEIEGGTTLPPRRDVLSQSDQELGLWFNEEGVRGVIRVPEDLAGESVLRLHSYGVLVESIRLQRPLDHIDGSINDDQLTLNVSQAGVVRNERFEQTMKIVGTHAGKLLLRVIGKQAGHLSEIGRQPLKELALVVWQDCFGGWDALAQYSFVRSPDYYWELFPGHWEKERTVMIRRAAWSTAWLREACVQRLHDLEADAADATLKALWDTAIFLSVNGKPLSLTQLEFQRQRLGHVPYSMEARPDLKLPYDVVLYDGARMLDILMRRFPHNCRDVTDRLDILAEDSRRKRSLLLEAAGVADLLIRDEFEAGPFRGEVGLPMAPEEEGGRLHVIRNAVPIGFIPLECGLRFVAAVNDPDSRKGANDPALLQDPDLRAVKVAAMEAARGLYRKVAPEYGGQMRTLRNGAIRTHLLDYLLMAIGERGAHVPLDERDRWIEGVMIFHTLDGWWSYARLRGAFEEGRAVAFLPEPSAEPQPGGKPAPLAITESLLSRLLPGSGFLTVPGKPNVRLVFKRRPTLSNDRYVLDGDDHALLDRLIALVGEKGTLYDVPDDPLRNFLLQAVGRLLAPWSDHEKTPEHVTLRGMLGHLPMFRRPDGTGCTVSDLGERLAAGVMVRYVPADHPQPDARADLVLTDEELGLIKRFWPSRKDRLVPFAPSSSLRSALPKKMLSPAPVPAKPITKQAVPQAPAPRSITRPRPAATPRPAAPPPPRAHPTPPSKKPGVVDLGRQILTELRGRRGVKLLSGMASLRLRPFSGGSLLDIGRAGIWSLNASHSMTQAVLGAPLPDSEKAAYLASFVYTAANRSLSYVTDLDDVKFQQALADHVTERRNG